MIIAISIIIFLIVAFFMFLFYISQANFSLFRENLRTVWHKIQVFRFMMRVIFKIFKRAFVHDFSKFSDQEAPFFMAAQSLNSLKYGSPEYKKCIKETLGPALKRHYDNNTHHPEHHEGGINSMGLLDQIELLCDWKAATLRTKNGDIQASIEINASRFGYSVETKQKYIQLLKDIKAW